MLNWSLTKPWEHLNPKCSEEVKICLATTVQVTPPIIPLDRFTRLKYVTAWVLRFVNNCRGRTLRQNDRILHKDYLRIIGSGEILDKSRSNHRLPYWDCSTPVWNRHNPQQLFDNTSPLARRFRSSSSGRSANALITPSCIRSFSMAITKLIIHSEPLLHAGPTLVLSSLSCRFHIIGSRKSVRSITRRCTICRRQAIRPQHQLLSLENE